MSLAPGTSPGEKNPHAYPLGYLSTGKLFSTITYGMDQLPNELVCMIGESLTHSDLSRFSRVSRTYWKLLEPPLYRLHALRDDRPMGSAIVRAVELADPDRPDTLAVSLAVLDKVTHFCRLDSAVLNRCRPTTTRFDSGRVGSLAFPQKIWIRFVHRPSLPLLHVAALKGLFDIAAWLLCQGASVDAPIPGSKITALSLAVLGNHVPTALLLLANHADPDLRVNGPEARDTPTVLHLACALGLGELADRLLSGQYVDTDPTELLGLYQRSCPSDIPGLAATLLRHGAEASEDIFHAFLRASKWQSAWGLLTSPPFSDHLTAQEASSMLWAILSLRHEVLASHVETAVLMLRHLLDYGANPDLGSLLWRQSSDVSYPTLLKLLPPLLEAGMNVKPGLSTRRHARWQAPAKYEIDDLLGHTSPYDVSQDDEGAAAQLAVVHLLLQHGARIGGATRGDALDSYPPGLDERTHERARWSYKLCQVLLVHCQSKPEHERAEDTRAFLSRFSKVQGKKYGRVIEGL